MRQIESDVNPMSNGRRALEYDLREGCWRSVSGGVTDGTAEFPYYKYGGVWKNRRKVSLEEKRKAPPVVGAVLGE